MRPAARRRPEYIRSAQRETANSIRKHRPDYWLIVLCALLASIGLVVVYSMGPALGEMHGENGSRFVTRQMIAIGLSVVAFFVTAKIPLKTWRRWTVPLLLVAGVATVIAMATPVNPDYPAHRWIRLGGLSLQSVEFLKFALLVWVSGFLAARYQQKLIGSFRKTLGPLLAGLIVVAFIVASVQSDLGSTGVMLAMLIAMLFVAGVPLRGLAIASIVIAIGVTLFIAPVQYRRERLANYLNPESNCQTTGYQACQALVAVGSGGIVGLGLGKSVSAYGYLPEAQNDSIFAIYAEKFGFLGSMILLGLFVTLFARMRRVIERAPDLFSQLVVVGVLAWLSTQAIINIGAMIGLLPLKGITLPFVSYGGTSVLFVGAALGLVYQVTYLTTLRGRRQPTDTENLTRQGRQHESSHDRRRIRGAYHPNLGRR